MQRLTGWLIGGATLKGDPKDALFLRIVFRFVSTVFLACHTLFLAFYLVIGITPLVWANAASAVLYAALLYVNRREVYPASALLVAVEISTYCVVSARFVGWEVGAQWYVTMIAIPFYLVGRIPSVIRKASVGCFSVSLVACYLVKCFCVPVYASPHLELMTAANVLLAIAGPILVISVLTLGNNLSERYYSSAISSLTEKANRDVLTGLWNRRYAETALEALFADPTRKNRAYLAILDIDLFKNVNDAYGHETGDRVLVWLAQEALASFRSTDLVVRWGGEEFLVALADTDQRGAHKAFSAFRDRIQSAELTVDGHPIPLTVTIGYDSCAVAATYADCIRRSDEALYQGKNSGRNRLVYRSA